MLLKSMQGNQFLEKKSYTFIEKIIYHGKILYYKDIMIPDEYDHLKIGISKNKLKWAIENESKFGDILLRMKFYLTQILNLKKDLLMMRRFQNFLEIDNDSTEKIGRFIGWNIVRSFMKNNNMSLDKMLQLDLRIYIIIQNISQLDNEKKISKIEIKVELDNNKVPEKIRWTASDGNINNQETKALFYPFGIQKNKESLRIDLWTKDMPLDEMKLFYQTLLVCQQHLRELLLMKKCHKQW